MVMLDFLHKKINEQSKVKGKCGKTHKRSVRLDNNVSWAVSPSASVPSTEIPPPAGQGQDASFKQEVQARLRELADNCRASDHILAFMEYLHQAGLSASNITNYITDLCTL